ncbi:MAG TPA: class II glutamine amidotransferase [Thermoplasmata archaeon]|nr:class II glutamine amidotransferase [Thermoplasmata archaeon]
MCRLFGMLGNVRSHGEPWLIDSDHSLLKQSNGSPEQVQSDGWGIAWVSTGEAVHVEKGSLGAFQPGEVEHFRSAAERSHGPLVIAHLRKASNPMGLPKERLLALENSQPFAYRHQIFAHNGSILYPRETRPFLGPYESKLQGVNDSEVLFYLFLRHLDQVREPVAAFSRSIGDLFRVWQEKGSPRGGPYSGLNVLFSRSPEELWAFCLYRGEHGHGLLDPSHPYYEMTYRTDARQMIVGSERFDSKHDDWRALPNGQFLHAWAEQGIVGAKIGTIPMPPELRALA